MQVLSFSNISAIKHNSNINNVISYIHYIHFFLYNFNLNYVNALVWNWDMCCASKKVVTSVHEEFEVMAVQRASVLSSIPCTRCTRKEKRGVHQGPPQDTLCTCFILEMIGHFLAT
jgi:hypothetical protein